MILQQEYHVTATAVVIMITTEVIITIVAATQVPISDIRTVNMYL